MKRFWDPGISQTVLFVLGVFTFMVGSYQTLATGGMDGLYDNYWLFMVSFGCVIGLRYLRQRDKEAAAEAEAAQKTAAKAAAKPASKTGRKPKKKK
ncbi:hypothetical protein [Hymenobacter rubripertinctus]|uniref:Uncharacterized protein n=1 Tax=Hymenobacter rubripertinctus TaxID=2029981 RepID=A0A418QS92_9BACT|nr:hypothetical protein [Hymenobacter rubripertinctus]RIY07948.1 hypothetical protein D0T11_15370 [Hymenobacter rubripertinctus]